MQAERLPVAAHQPHLLVRRHPAERRTARGEQHQPGVQGSSAAAGSNASPRCTARRARRRRGTRPSRSSRVDGVGRPVLVGGQADRRRLDPQRHVLGDQADVAALGARFSATTRIRLSLVSVRNPAGSTDGSLWLSSTCSVPPSSPIGTGASSRPCGHSQVVQQPQRLPGEPAELGVVPLALQLGDHDERQHHVVVVEAHERPRVGEQDRGVEHERAASGHDSAPVGRTARPRSKVAGPRRRGRMPAPLVDELVSTNRASRGRRGQLVIHRER